MVSSPCIRTPIPSPYFSLTPLHLDPRFLPSSSIFPPSLTSPLRLHLHPDIALSRLPPFPARFLGLASSRCPQTYYNRFDTWYRLLCKHLYALSKALQILFGQKVLCCVGAIRLSGSMCGDGRYWIGRRPAKLASTFEGGAIFLTCEIQDILLEWQQKRQRPLTSICKSDLSQNKQASCAPFLV